MHVSIYTALQLISTIKLFFKQVCLLLQKEKQLQTFTSLKYPLPVQLQLHLITGRNVPANNQQQSSLNKNRLL